MALADATAGGGDSAAEPEAPTCSTVALDRDTWAQAGKISTTAVHAGLMNAASFTGRPFFGNVASRRLRWLLLIGFREELLCPPA